jgi:hypothetical protein
MLFGETVPVYCENHTEHINTLRGQNAEFWYVKAGGTYSNHCALKDLSLDNLYSLMHKNWTEVFITVRKIKHE